MWRMAIGSPERDLADHGSVVVRDPHEAQRLWENARIAGFSGATLDMAYVVRIPEHTHEEVPVLHDRVMVLLLAIGLALFVGAMIGGAAVEAVEHAVHGIAP